MIPVIASPPSPSLLGPSHYALLRSLESPRYGDSVAARRSSAGPADRSTKSAGPTHHLLNRSLGPNLSVPMQQSIDGADLRPTKHVRHHIGQDGDPLPQFAERRSDSRPRRRRSRPLGSPTAVQLDPAPETWDGKPGLVPTQRHDQRAPDLHGKRWDGNASLSPNHGAALVWGHRVG